MITGSWVSYFFVRTIRLIQSQRREKKYNKITIDGNNLPATWNRIKENIKNTTTTTLAGKVMWCVYGVLLVQFICRVSMLYKGGRSREMEVDKSMITTMYLRVLYCAGISRSLLLSFTVAKLFHYRCRLVISFNNKMPCRAILR